MKPVRVLIVDDESNLRLMMRTALDSEGYYIEESGDGRTALESIRRSTPDLVLLDLNLPGMDGMALLQQLAASGGLAHPRVIVLTAYGSISTAVQATRLGAADFLEKPVTPKAVRDIVREVLDEPALIVINSQPPQTEAYEQVLNRVRHALQLVDVADAEALLADASNRRTKLDADYFNMLGVLYEVQCRWRLARKFYGKAMALDKTHEPAMTNLRRLYELHAFGRTDHSIMLGAGPVVHEPISLATHHSSSSVRKPHAR